MYRQEDAEVGIARREGLGRVGVREEIAEGRDGAQSAPPHARSKLKGLQMEYIDIIWFCYFATPFAFLPAALLGKVLLKLTWNGGDNI